MSKYGIVGAGITGLTLAQALDDYLVVEKSRGLGGRLASRRLADHAIEHGAKAFLHPVLNKIVQKPHAWIKSEANHLAILRSWEASYFTTLNGSIDIFNLQGEKIPCQNLIITAPAPQAKKIIERSGLEAGFLDSVVYRSEIQLLLLAKNDSIGEQFKEHFDLTSKETTPDGCHALLFTMKSKFHPTFLELDKEIIKNHFIRGSQDILDAHVHKWRYSEVLNSIDPSWQLKLADKNVYLAGDYFSPNGIVGAFHSANLLLNIFGKRFT